GDAVALVDEDGFGDAQFDQAEHSLEFGALVGAGAAAGLDEDADDLVPVGAGPGLALFLLGVEAVAGDLLGATDSGVDDDFHSKNLVFKLVGWCPTTTPVRNLAKYAQSGR